MLVLLLEILSADNGLKEEIPVNVWRTQARAQIRMDSLISDTQTSIHALSDQAEDGDLITIATIFYHSLWKKHSA